MAVNDREGGPPEPGPGTDRRRRTVPVRRLAPGLLIVALLALPTGWVVRGRIIDARPASSAGFGGRGLFGGDDDAGSDGNFETGDAEAVDINDFLDPDLLDAVPVGADEVADPVKAILAGADVIDALDDSGIPAVARDAYNEAERELAAADPSCNISWSLLAAIGRVESDHGRFGGARLTENGYGTKKILGIPLDGRPDIALIRDSDGGELDDDRTFDRAVGPMQIIPTTWRGIASDGNGDDRRDPNNIYDAAQGAARYLCSGNDDLGELEGRRRGLRRYNNAYSYVEMVSHLADLYETGDIGVVEDAIERDVDFDEELLDVPPLPAFTPAPPPPPPAPAPEPRPGPAPAPPSTVAPAPAPPAAVGWAPSTRIVVVIILKEQEQAKNPAPPPPAPAESTCGPTTTAAPNAGPAPTTTTKPPAPTTTTKPNGSAGPSCPPPAGNGPGPSTTAAGPAKDGPGRR